MLLLTILRAKHTVNLKETDFYLHYQGIKIRIQLSKTEKFETDHI